MATKDERRPLTPRSMEDGKIGRFEFKRQTGTSATDTTRRKWCSCLTKLPPLPLSIPLAIHYTCVTLALITTAQNSWLPAYFFSHIVVILAGVWAARDVLKIQPVLLYMYIICMSCVVDCIQLGAFYTRYNENTIVEGPLDRNIFLLSVVAVSTHLVVKPIVVAYSVLIVFQRSPQLLSKCCGGSPGRYENSSTNNIETNPDLSIGSNSTLQGNGR